MDAPTPNRKPADLAELIFTQTGEPNSQVLAQLEAAIRAGVEAARPNGEPKIDLKKWALADPDAAPNALAEAVHQAEDKIRDLAAASLPRAQEMAEWLRRPAEQPKAQGLWSRVRAIVLRLFRRPAPLPEPQVGPAEQIRVAEERLKQTAARLARTGIIPSAKVIEESAVPN